MLRSVALARTDVSEELSASIIRVTRIGELGTTLAVTSNRRTLRNIIRIIKSRRMRWAGHMTLMREKRNVYRLLVGTPKGNRSLRRTRHRWVGNIKMDFSEIGYGGVEWIGVAQERDR
jgi:hypothetical protein